MKPLETSTAENKKESSIKDESGPKAADWRFGPAQIWYDMLEVPETGDGFNYGFKTLENPCVRLMIILCNLLFNTN